METALENLPLDDIHWRQVAMIGLGLAQLAEGQAASAKSTLHKAALICEQYDDLYLAFAAWWHKLEACWAQGRLHEAAECLRWLEDLAEQDEGNWLALRDNAAVGWGMLAYERNELTTAEQQISAALPNIWPGGQPRVVLQAYLTLARAAQARGDLEKMGRHLKTAEQLVHHLNMTAEQRLLTPVAVRWHIAEGKLPEAYWQLENQEIGPESAPDFRHESGLLSLVRLYLAEGRATEALTILGRLLPPAELAGRDGSLIEINLLQALALARRSQHDRALACLNRALALAEPEQFGRIFINEGRPLAQLLSQVAPRTPYVAHLLAQMESTPGVELLADPLTERELEILTLVAEGAGNQAIADQLVISLGTVKGHLNHILSKLNARNRTEAAALGRELGLLPLEYNPKHNQS
jgi:LuxR family maltose regulon positive regulatory protein